ncbi:MAG: hypothetical protein EOP84_04150 [Verrucomicrobiaceae bacterium]|nr:MAG: hypothetical protein EOP84_04150 [Verrucomicrobiaceae bacterium]
MTWNPCSRPLPTYASWRPGSRRNSGGIREATTSSGGTRHGTTPLTPTHHSPWMTSRTRCSTSSPNGWTRHHRTVSCSSNCITDRGALAALHRSLRMQPFIKALWSSHLSPIEEWVPEANHTVQYWLDVDVGFGDDPGVEFFSVLILTEDSQRHFNLKRTPPKRCLVIPGDYQWEKVQEHIQSVFDSCLTADPLDFCDRLAKHFKWDDWGIPKGKRRNRAKHDDGGQPTPHLDSK